MLLEIGKLAKRAATGMLNLTAEQKNRALQMMATSLREHMAEVLEANRKDMQNPDIPAKMHDRLLLTEQRIEQMVEGIMQIWALPDPIGESVRGFTRPNGMRISQVRTPIGVIAIIYEARPNVTADAIALCLKTSNVCILRGGKEAINSNIAIANILANAARAAGLPENCINIVTDTDRETAKQLMKLNGYVDLLIPRGGASLIRTVVDNATVPVIETGVGNCHAYIDEGADEAMAVELVENAKCSRPSVCNAIETLLVHKNSAEILRKIQQRLKEVELRGCDRTCALLPSVKRATDEDYATEFNALILAVKVVEDLEEAIAHIRAYGSGHSELIITNNYAHSEYFLKNVDAAAVFVNASTRFTDGGEFGFGAEIGISTQKIHARGPMGLRELTTTKYIIHGDGQIR